MRNYQTKLKSKSG